MLATPRIGTPPMRFGCNVSWETPALRKRSHDSLPNVESVLYLHEMVVLAVKHIGASSLFERGKLYLAETKFTDTLKLRNLNYMYKYMYKLYMYNMLT